MPRSISRRELAFLSLLCQREREPKVKSLMLEDLTWMASQLRDDGVDYLLKAAVLAAPQHFPAVRLINFIGQMPRSKRVDILVVTVKKVELYGVQAVFGIPRSIAGISGDASSRFWETSLSLPSEGRAVSIAITVAGEAQNYKMSSFMHLALSQYKPKLVILLGMAAGRKGRVKLGDVVLARDIVDYGNVVLSDVGMIPDPQNYAPQLEASRTLIAFEPFKSVWKEDVLRIISEEAQLEPGARQALPPRILTDLGSYDPNIQAGTVMSADYLMEDDSFEARAAELLKRKALAAEMEGAGFACICKEARLPWMVMRGIADHGTQKRVKHWQYVSTVAAATAFRLLISEKVVSIPSDTADPVTGRSY